MHILFTPFCLFCLFYYCNFRYEEPWIVSFPKKQRNSHLFFTLLVFLDFCYYCNVLDMSPTCRSEEFYRYALGLCQEKFGKLGAFKLLVEYRVSCNRSDATVFDILKSFEKIENTTESLQDLQDKLTKVGLLRASSVISQYIGNHLCLYLWNSFYQ